MPGNSSENSSENSSGSGMCPERFFLFPVPLPAGAALFRMGEKSNRGCFSVKFKFSPEFRPSEIPPGPERYPDPASFQRRQICRREKEEKTVIFQFFFLPIMRISAMNSSISLKSL